MTRILVTGGAGFIGSHVVEALLRRGDSVRVLDNFSTGNASNLAAVADAVELLEGDIRDAGAVERACAGVQTVIHLAALTGVQASVDDPQAAHDHNVTGSLHVLLAARDAGARRVVLASSAAVYGDPALVPTPETAPLAPLSPYGASKVAMEQSGAAFAAAYGFSVISLRFFNVYGPRQARQSDYAAVIPAFIEAIRRGEAPIIFGDGLQSRDFVHVEDVASAIVAALNAPPELSGAFNVGTGRALTLLELADALGTELPPQFRDAKSGDIRHSRADPAKAKRLLGWQAPDRPVRAWAIDNRPGLPSDNAP